MKILIVDDEDLIRTVIKEYCSNSNYETEEASSGKEALELLKTKDYDLMVLDIMMPEMDGFTMLKELPVEKRIPTIVLSARGEEYDKLSGFDLGIDDYITKPFSPKELLARIKAVLSRTSKQMPTIYKLDSLEINYSAHTLNFFGDDRTVDTHIKMLRNNLGKYRNHIITVRGVGYKYVENEE